ncbi:MAG: glycosyltransferase family 39 protein [Patescibacteria group bacterium]
MKKIALIGIIMLAIGLRFWQLGEVPVSPDWDEAALGYNAYSILKTGRDEYGTFLPRALRSFDDYKPPLYVYLAVPSVAVFGLNTWAVRLPAAVMGVFAVLGTYFLVAELFKQPHIKTKKRISEFSTQALSLLTAFLLAISPWHLQFSRIAFEANTGVTFNIWGLVAFFRGLQSLPWMAASAFFFGLSLYAYHSERIFVPLLLLIVSVVCRKELFADRRKLLIGIVVGLLTVLPLLPVVLDKTSVTRLKGTSTLSDATGLLMRSVAKLDDDQKVGNEIGTIFDNRRIVYAKTLLDGYLSHFSLRWLFLVGDNDRHHAPDNGLLYFWELPFMVWGIFSVWRRGGRAAMVLLSWVLVAPLAASPTSETPHAIRTLVILPVLQIFIASGVMEFLTHTKKYYEKRRTVFVWVPAGVLVTAVFLNILFYFHMYYVHLNHEYSKFWQYGYAQAVEYAESHKAKYEKIVVSTALEQPHMFFLFYTKYDPVKYLASGGTSSGGFAEVKNRFDMYEFRPISNWAKELHDGSILYIGSPRELPGDAYTITYLNGDDAMRISE